MSIWAIADLHLSFGTPNKEMSVFGSNWDQHGQKIAEAWKKKVSADDLVLIAGDISWAMKMEEAVADLDWIAKLPGTKVMIKGNHDYWWSSISKVRQHLPSSCFAIQNDSFNWNDTAIAGTRLWDIEADFSPYIDFQENKRAKPLTESDHTEEREKIFKRELQRLEISLQSMNPLAKHRIVMTHYPPVSVDLRDNEVSKLLEKYRVNICVFGHLHNLKPEPSLFGTHNGIEYILVACDYRNQFSPIKIV